MLSARPTVDYKKKAERLKNRIQFARASRTTQVASEGGTWTQAAADIAQADQSTALPIMPPSFCALNDAACLRKIADMYEFLDKLHWYTCVVCWRAWFSLPLNHNFREAPRPGSASHGASEESWFHPGLSVTLRMSQRKQVNQWVMDFDPRQGDAAHQYVRQNYPAETSERILANLADADTGRGICICTSCAPHAENTRSSSGLKCVCVIML
jgi:hypothetical protein